jgi:hypothetical protein
MGTGLSQTVQKAFEDISFPSSQALDHLLIVLRNFISMEFAFTYEWSTNFESSALKYATQALTLIENEYHK